MEFHIKILLLSFVVSTILGIIIIPILKLFKVGQIERSDGPESHLKKQGTPTMGGIIIAAAVFIVCTFLYVQYSKKDITLARNILPLLFVTIGFGLVGFIDDFKKLVLKNTKGLKPLYKMIGLLIVAVIYTLFLTNVLKIGTDIYIPFIKEYINLPMWAYIPFAIFVLLGTTNAVNLTDGIDGLSTTVTTIILTCLTVISIIFGVKEVTLVGSALVGACLGFLLFNLHPAKVFMGDTGSLSLGATLAAVAILTEHELSLAVIGGVFVIEALSSIIQLTAIKKFGKKVFLMTPIHHHFEKLGWEETDIVKMFYIVGFMLGMVAIYYGVWM